MFKYLLASNCNILSCQSLSLDVTEDRKGKERAFQEGSQNKCLYLRTKIHHNLTINEGAQYDFMIIQKGTDEANGV